MQLNSNTVVGHGFEGQELQSSIPPSRYTSRGSLPASVGTVSRNALFVRSRCTIPEFHDDSFPQEDRCELPNCIGSSCEEGEGSLGDTKGHWKVGAR